MSTSGFWLTEEQFARLEPLLPSDTRGVPRVDDRRVISGIVHVLRSGCRWQDAPAVYGPHKTLYNRFVRWAAKGVWDDLFRQLAEAGGPPSALMLDGDRVNAMRSREPDHHVKVQRAAAGGKGGPRRRRSASPAAGGPPSSTPPSTNEDGRAG